MAEKGHTIADLEIARRCVSAGSSGPSPAIRGRNQILVASESPQQPAIDPIVGRQQIADADDGRDAVRWDGSARESRHVEGIPDHVQVPGNKEAPRPPRAFERSGTVAHLAARPQGAQSADNGATFLLGPDEIVTNGSDGGSASSRAPTYPTKFT